MLGAKPVQEAQPVNLDGLVLAVLFCLPWFDVQVKFSKYPSLELNAQVGLLSMEAQKLQASVVTGPTGIYCCVRSLCYCSPSLHVSLCHKSYCKATAQRQGNSTHLQAHTNRQVGGECHGCVYLAVCYETVSSYGAAQ